MSKPILFVIHGMGVNKSGWVKEIKDSLQESMTYYPRLEDKKLSSMVKVVALTYDDEFEKLRKLWKDDAAKVIKKMQKPDSDDGESYLSPAEADKLFDIQQKLSADSFFNTHILDVLLYRYTMLGEKIRIKVAKQITDTLLAETGAVPEWSLMAHSLGTSVAHDTLHALYASKAWRNGKVNKAFTPSAYKASTVIMLANVSRVLQTSKAQAYTSRVKPGKGGMCEHFINAAHQFDPIARTKQFDPGDEWLKAQDAVELYENIAINLINQVNVHSYTHYLANPKVHVPIFRCLYGEDAISIKHANQSYDDYFDKSPNNAFDEVRKSLKALDIGEPQSLQAVLTNWQRFSDIIEQFQGE